jgi:hypothetical protein
MARISSSNKFPKGNYDRVLLIYKSFPRETISHSMP